jgi:ketosteroid isomerase-like protein
MSEQTNVRVVQQAYEAFGRGDIPAVLDALTDDVQWTFQGSPVIPFAGTFRGRQGIAGFFSVLDETLEFEQFEPRGFVAQGETVVVLGYERSVAKTTGRSFEQEWAHVYTLRDGKIATGRFFEDTAAEADAISPA